MLQLAGSPLRDWLYMLLELCNSCKHNSIAQMLHCDIAAADPALTGQSATASCVTLLVPHSRLWAWSFEAITGSLNDSQGLLQALVDGKLVDRGTSQLKQGLTEPLEVRSMMSG